MKHLLGIPMDGNSQLQRSLCKIPGIGIKTQKYICRECQIVPTVKWKTLTDDQVRVLSQWLEEFQEQHEISVEYRNKMKGYKENLIGLNSYRGRRLREGLPVRGQRTHSNAKTQKSIKGRV